MVHVTPCASMLSSCSCMKSSNAWMVDVGVDGCRWVRYIDTIDVIVEG